MCICAHYTLYAFHLLIVKGIALSFSVTERLCSKPSPLHNFVIIRKLKSCSVPLETLYWPDIWPQIDTFWSIFWFSTLSFSKRPYIQDLNAVDSVFFCLPQINVCNNDVMVVMHNDTSISLILFFMKLQHVLLPNLTYFLFGLKTVWEKTMPVICFCIFSYRLYKVGRKCQMLIKWVIIYYTNF